MAAERPNLDEATIRVARQVLAMPPIRNEDLKVGQPAKDKKSTAGKKKRSAKGRASSSKPHTA